MPDLPVRRASVSVRLPEGLHLRPATLLSRLAATFSSEILLRKGQLTANARGMLDLMSLAAMCGEQLELEVRGADADAAADAVIRLFESNFADREPHIE